LMKEVAEKIQDYISTQAEIPSSSHPDFLKKWEGNETMIAFSRNEMECVLEEKGLLKMAADSKPSTAAQVVKASIPPAIVDRAQVQKKLDFLKDLVKIFFKILKSQVEDHVPKMIKKHLVYFASREIQAAMVYV